MGCSPLWQRRFTTFGRAHLEGVVPKPRSAVVSVLRPAAATSKFSIFLEFASALHQRMPFFFPVFAFGQHTPDTASGARRLRRINVRVIRAATRIRHRTGGWALMRRERRAPITRAAWTGAVRGCALDRIIFFFPRPGHGVT